MSCLHHDRQAHEMGEDAALEDAARSSNPFPAKTSSRAAWFRGYDAEKTSHLTGTDDRGRDAYGLSSRRPATPPPTICATSWAA